MPEVEEEIHCPACGETQFECHGHGIVSDPIGWNVLKAHWENDNHTYCRLIAGCPLLAERDGDVLYIGPLQPALVLVNENRSIYYGSGNASASSVALHTVRFCTPSRMEVAANVQWEPLVEDEWGNSMRNAEEALRFAMGAMFGPIDAEYDEAALRSALMHREN